MQGFKAEGVILKRKNFGEADRILTVLTLQRGKISVIAKGVRRINSRRAGNVELLNRSQLFLHPGKNFLILTEAVTLDSFQELKNNLIISTYCYHILELVDRMCAENQENRLLYNELIQVLESLKNSPRQIFVRAFEVKILNDLGFLNINSLNVSSEETKQLLQKLQDLPWEKIKELSINEKQAMELERILRYYIEKVLETKLKSRQFLKNI